MTYYNTTQLHGELLARRGKSTVAQDIAILRFFAQHPGEKFTRDEIHEQVLPQAQNTSITRALNTLMKANRTTKLAEYRPGKMGARQHLWQYVP